MEDRREPRAAGRLRPGWSACLLPACPPGRLSRRGGPLRSPLRGTPRTGRVQQVSPGQVSPEPVGPEQVDPEQVDPERVGPELMGADLVVGVGCRPGATTAAVREVVTEL